MTHSGIVEYLMLLILKFIDYLLLPIQKGSVPITRISGIRTIKRVAMKVGRQVATNYNLLQSYEKYAELDSHADTTCLGTTFVPIYYTGEECEVAPYLSEYDTMKGIQVVTAVSAYDNEDTGETIILQINQGLYFGERMEESLINPNQVRSHGLYLNDNPFEPGELFGLHDYETDVSIPFSVRNGIVSFKTRTPTETEIENCKHVVLTSDETWDPSAIDTSSDYSARNQGRIVSKIMRTDLGENVYDNTHESILSQVSSIFSDKELVKQIASMVTVASEYNTDEVNLNTEHGKILRSDSERNKNVSSILTNARHSATKPETLERNWDIGYNKAKCTMECTTQHGTRQSVHPLTRRYRTDLLQLKYRRLSDVWYTDTLFSKVKSLKGNTCAQLFTNGSFLWIYPMQSKSEVSDALIMFMEDVGIPRKLIFDGSQEQNGPNSKFMRTVKRNQIMWSNTEPYSQWQNRAELGVREVKTKVKHRRCRRKVPRRLWDFQFKHAAEVMNYTFKKNIGVTPYELVTGDTPDISEYLDFGFWDLVWFWDKPKAEDNPKLARWLGVAHRVGSALCYYVIKGNGQIESRTTVQHVTKLDMEENETQQQLRAFEADLNKRLDDKNFILNDDLDHDLWLDDIDSDDEGIGLEDEKGYIEPRDTYVPELDERDQYVASDEHYSEDAADQYIGAEVNMPSGGDHMRATVKRRKIDEEGNPVGKGSNNPLLDTRLYVVEYSDGTLKEIQGNLIAQSMLSQVDSEGHHYVLLDEISDHKSDGHAIQKEDGYFTGRNGNKHKKKTTRGWHLLVNWKDGTSEWVALKDLKHSNPVELAEYAVRNKISDEPAFAWWVADTLKKRNRIISKVKGRYWRTTHKYGIRLPHSVEEAMKIDEQNGTTVWTDAIKKEMSKIRSMHTFERWDKASADELRKRPQLLPTYKEASVHMVFDIKLDGKFTRKARLVADGHKTETPTSSTYSSVVSRESVRIAFLYANLNNLDILSCDVANAYLCADNKERLWLKAGKEFGSDEGSVMIIRKALYGLKSAGNSWHNLMSETILNMGYVNSIADPDVWRRRVRDEKGNDYYELLLVYVDDILCVSRKPMETMDVINSLFSLKEPAKEPDMYLGAVIGRWQLPDGRWAWSMSAKGYLKEAVAIVKDMLSKEGRKMTGGKRAERPYPKSYKPELDTTSELSDKMVQRYQQLIGILRWGVELGRLDILYEVSCLSSHLALPRVGHLEAVYNIFGYIAKHLDSTIVFDDKDVSAPESAFAHEDWSESIYGNLPEQLPGNMPEPLGKEVKISVFVDADHAGDKVTRRSQTGILIFLNNAPIDWYSKKQNTVESSTFGSEFIAARIACDKVEALRYKLRMFGISIDGPADVYCDNGSVVTSAQKVEGRLNKKHNAICFHRVRECVAHGIIRVTKEDGGTNLADLFTKSLEPTKRREILRSIFVKGG